MLFPFRLTQVLVTLMRQRFGAETGTRSQDGRLRIEIRQRPGALIQVFTQRGFSLRLMAIGDFLNRTFRPLQLHGWSRRLADVSMYAFTVEGERRSKSRKHLA
jgi:hypothetical protein